MLIIFMTYYSISSKGHQTVMMLISNSHWCDTSICIVLVTVRRRKYVTYFLEIYINYNVFVVYPQFQQFILRYTFFQKYQRTTWPWYFYVWFSRRIKNKSSTNNSNDIPATSDTIIATFFRNGLIVRTIKNMVLTAGAVETTLGKLASLGRIPAAKVTIVENFGGSRLS